MQSHFTAIVNLPSLARNLKFQNLCNKAIKFFLHWFKTTVNFPPFIMLKACTHLSIDAWDWERDHCSSSFLSLKQKNPLVNAFFAFLRKLQFSWRSSPARKVSCYGVDVLIKVCSCWWFGQSRPLSRICLKI
jgi:hypothetical protein